MSLDHFHQWCARWLPIIGGFIVIAAAIFGSIKYIVNSEVSGMANDITTIKNTLQPLPEAIHSLDIRITKLETRWDDLRLETLSQKPVSKETVGAVRQVLDEARSASLALPAESIRSTGIKFVDASQKSPDAWDAVTALLEYRSYLSLLNVPMNTSLNRLEATNYQIPAKNILSVPKPSELRIPSESPNIPEMRALDAPSENQNVKVGPAFLVIDGGSLLLDGVYWRRIVFRNTHIVYRGGPVQMQDVYFLNCSFEVRRDASGQQFAITLLATDPAVSKRIG